MSKQKDMQQLDDVYAAQSTEQIAATYDDWAGDYDSNMLQAGYRHPMVCLGLLTRYVPVDAGPVLDAGQGTGLVGEWLKILGYGEVAGFDVSDGMIAVSREKGVYDDLRKATLGDGLPYESNYFAGCVCAGVFTIGHAGPEGLDELLRVVKAGGHVVATVKDKLYEEGFSQYLERRIQEGHCRVAEMTPSYVSVPGQTGHSTSRALAIEVI